MHRTDRTIERAARAADLNMAQVTPVDLSLLARQGAQAKEGLGWWTRTHPRNEESEMRLGTRVAALADHRVWTGGNERRETRYHFGTSMPLRVGASTP